MLAAIRPDSWNFPLLLHVLGASVLIGGLLVAVAAQFLAWGRREDSNVYGRYAFRSLLFVAFPAWWVMRIGGQWIYSREGLDELDPEPGWVGVGFITAEGGGVLLLISIVLAGLSVRRQGTVLARIATVLVAIVLVAYLVATWAMTAKPD
ncbi:MAG: hypothetical protein ACRDM8_03600 [Gaiellaceae bacterium]|jgi:hypothetical protein